MTFNFMECSKHNSFYFGDVLTSQEMGEFLNWLHKEPDKDIFIYLDSVGGDYVTGINIYTTLMHFPKHVITFNTNQCLSASTLIYLAGDYRISYKFSYFLVHEPRLINVELRKKEFSRMSKYIIDADQEYLDIMVERTVKDRNFWSDLIKKETVLTGEESFEYGLSNVLVTRNKTFLRDNDNNIYEVKDFLTELTNCKEM